MTPLPGLQVHVTDHRLKDHFTTAHGRMESVTLVHVTDGTAWGMAAPAPSVTGSTVAQVERQLREGLPRCPEALAAMDLLALDRQARQEAETEGQPVGVHEVLRLPRRPLRSMITLPADTPEAMAARAADLARAGVGTLKLKMSDEADRDRVMAVVDAAPKARIALDANEAWTPDAALSMMNDLHDQGVQLVLVEQPVHRDDLEGQVRVTQGAPCPILADESMRTVTDVNRLAEAGACDLINVKVQKVGGLRPALAICREAEAEGLGVVIGCNIESGLGIAAGACLTPLARWIDLDGNTFLAEDPFPGIDAIRDKVQAGRPGLGVEPRDGWP